MFRTETDHLSIIKSWQRVYDTILHYQSRHRRDIAARILVKCISDFSTTDDVTLRFFLIRVQLSPIKTITLRRYGRREHLRVFNHRK